MQYTPVQSGEATMTTLLKDPRRQNFQDNPGWDACCHSNPQVGKDFNNLNLGAKVIQPMIESSPEC